MRPQSVFNGKRFDHPFNTHLLRVLELDSEVVRTRETLERALQDEGAAAGSLVAAGGADPAAGGSSGAARDARTLLRLWLTLQTAVNAVLDSSTVPRPAGQPEVMGIRQTLERKEGLFRSNMMGKRVNFAARSVISPDGYLRGGEIGVPPYIASRLCFPERVTPWNVERLCEAVLAGPGKIPGAFAVEDERGRVLMLRPDRASREAVARRLYGDMRSAGARRASSEASSRGKSLGNPRDPGSEAAAATSAAAPTSRRTSSAAHAELSEFGGCRVVYRCLEDGDALLTNRQPTLHKPGILAHRARIMRGERTIRMHYANCSTFNADFDGDEINLHLPQDHAARAEAYGLVSADAQFCVPTDGKPLRGLIQDHVVAGTLLASRDTLIPRARYASLVLEAVGADAAGSGEVWLDGPAVLKPQALWTGKQVITAVLMHYARDSLPLSFQTATKTPLAAWGARSGEGQLVVQRGHLVAGVLDKHAFGKHGLLHLVHELYGPDRAALLTAALSRLLTAFLQLNGFTCGLADVGLVARAEDARADVLAQAERRCAEAAAQLVEAGHEQGGDASASRLLRKRLGAALRASPDLGAALDMRSSGAMHPLGSEIVKACLPGGAARAFRHNMMSLMTMTGAKGSVVNFSQISCLLGQQELEGRRVPRMSSGASLPCFAPWDAGARAGGFVGDRFLTGLRPQEYYFHCMAGREGLVDTTVKTSRSGYLQRCMVKSLEPLHVAYDGSVRDAADQRIVQFRYGEDGVDPSRVGCLRTLPLFFNNQAQLARRLGLDRREGEGAPDAENAKEAEPRGRADVPAAVRDLLAGAAPGSDAAAAAEAPWGSVSPGFAKMLDEALCGGLLVPPARGREALAAAARGEGSPDAYGAGNPAGFARLMQAWFAACRAAAGESVGVVAAQSIGEPSTQMTLNTFHMAGRGEANVTLGIPRLREILMTASSNLKTPVMTLPLRPGRDAAALAGRLRRLRLAEALGALRVRKRVLVGGVQGTEYVVSLEFHPEGAYPAALGLTWDEIVRCVDGQFRGRLEHAVKLQLRRARARLVGQVGLQERPIGARRRGVAADEGGEDAEDVERPRPVGDGGAGSDEEAEVDEDEETNEEFVEGKMRGQGSRYEEQDEDDARIASLARINEAARRGEVASDDEEGDEEDQPPKAMDGEASELEDDSEASSGEGEAIGCRTQGARLAVERLAKANLTANAAGRTFELTVVLPPGAPRLLVLELAERVAAECTIRGTPGLTKCYVLEAARGQAAAVQTDGINLAGAWAHSDLVDVDAIATNSPAVMLKNYGVEAARAAIVREVSTVFGAYGIGVDNRHLNLIADAMTQLGGYRPCSRLGIAASASPLLKVTFETATAFLVAATLHGHSDSLGAPAASIIVGQPVRLGTGSFGIMHQV